MLFDNVESAKKFYKDYAHDLGFYIRNGQQRLDGNGVVEWKWFLCSRAGYRKKKEIEHNNSSKKSKKTRRTR